MEIGCYKCRSTLIWITNSFQCKCIDGIHIHRMVAHRLFGLPRKRRVWNHEKQEERCILHTGTQCSVQYSAVMNHDYIENNI